VQHAHRFFVHILFINRICVVLAEEEGDARRRLREFVRTRDVVQLPLLILFNGSGLREMTAAFRWLHLSQP
jgi:hypothetical protein